MRSRIKRSKFAKIAEFSSRDHMPSLDRTPPKSCLIVGGGMTGLIAGTILQRHGIAVTILDKGRGIGGRLATRRIEHPVYGTGVFDYGMQAFSVSKPQFQVWVDEWLERGIVDRWDIPSPTGMMSYRGKPSSRSIAQHLAQDLDVRTQTLVVEATWAALTWTVRSDKGELFQAESLLIATPIPQALALLDNSAIDLPIALKNRLAAVVYQPCISLLALLDKPSQIPAPGGLRLEDPTLAWIACNQQKGTSPQAPAVTLQATPTFSHTHWELDRSAIAQILLDRAAPLLGANIVEFYVHHWLYSQPQTCYGETYVALDAPGMLVLAGDAFAPTHPIDISLQLECAVLSGLAAAAQIAIS
jgi:renalase